ncbi:dual specificity protein phosphatase family protein [bacterium]|nr:dual specificity protein phosphatase family protein [candidate division CSSED10-310 bacterium]
MTSRRIRRIWLILLVLVAVTSGAWYIKRVNIDCRFQEVEKDRFYKSGVMPPKTLKKCLDRHRIKTVIDLRNPGTGNKLNPEEWNEILQERDVLQQAGVRHANIPSKQVPKPETIKQFFEVTDDSESYPILVHCYHGTGRAELFTALYRIEYLGWSVNDAVSATRLIIAGSSFAADKPKGIFLRQYQTRSTFTDQTSNQITPGSDSES